MWRSPVGGTMRQLDTCALRGRGEELISVVSSHLFRVLIVVLGEVGQLGEESVRAGRVLPLSRRGCASCSRSCSGLVLLHQGEIRPVLAQVREAVDGTTLVDKSFRIG